METMMSEQEAQAEARAWARDVLGIADDEPNAATGSDIADSFHMLTEAYIAGASRVPVVAPSDTDNRETLRMARATVEAVLNDSLTVGAGNAVRAAQVVMALQGAGLLSPAQPVQVEVAAIAAAIAATIEMFGSKLVAILQEEGHDHECNAVLIENVATCDCWWGKAKRLDDARRALVAALGGGESEGDWEDPHADDCAACDAMLSECSRDAACCGDCTHGANWPPLGGGDQ